MLVIVKIELYVPDNFALSALQDLKQTWCQTVCHSDSESDSEQEDSCWEGI